MLKQANIQIDLQRLKSLYDQFQKEDQIRQKSYLSQENKAKIDDHRTQHEYVKQQLFPNEFTPFFIQKYSKNSTMNLYPVEITEKSLTQAKHRLIKLYQTITKIKKISQQETLIEIFQLHEVQNLIQHCQQQLKTSPEAKIFYPYCEQGQTFDQVEMWKFEHQQEKPTVQYNQRQKIMQEFQLIVKVIKELYKMKICDHFCDKDIRMTKYNKLNQFNCEYKWVIKTKFVFDLIFNSHFTEQKQPQLLQSLRKILRKILSVPQQSKDLTPLQQLHHQKTQFLISFDDIIKLKYTDFYPRPIQQKKAYSGDGASRAEQLEILRQEIHRLEELAKKSISGLKVNTQPRIKATTKKQNPNFWKDIEQFILNNITQSERKEILTAKDKKSQELLKPGKKDDRKGNSTQVKKATKQPGKTGAKQQKQAKNQEKKEKQSSQIQVTAQFITSASSIQFRPQKLTQLITSRESLLYILKTHKPQPPFTNPSYITCFINHKLPPTPQQKVFGMYYPDLTKNSFIYSSVTQKFYPLNDKNNVVGYGPELFLAIGKIDIVVPCFGVEVVDEQQFIKCVSYFPCSYAGRGVEVEHIGKVHEEEVRIQEKQENFGKPSQIGLEREFYLQDIDIYEIKIKPK